MVACILVGSMILSRRRNFRIFDKGDYGILERALDSARAWDDSLARISMLGSNLEDDNGSVEMVSTSKFPPKKRRCCGTSLYTPNSSRFANYCHSRVLQKYPFLIEMFYWMITYALYRYSKVLSQSMSNEVGVWDVAEDHAIAVMEFEQFSWLSFLWPLKELDVQKWFLKHSALLTILNRSYALIHIPGTVGQVSTIVTQLENVMLVL